MVQAIRHHQSASPFKTWKQLEIQKNLFNENQKQKKNFPLLLYSDVFVVITCLYKTDSSLYLIMENSIHYFNIELWYSDKKWFSDQAGLFGQRFICQNLFAYIIIIISNTHFYLSNYIFISHTSHHKKCYSKNISNNLQSKHTHVISLVLTIKRTKCNTSPHNQKLKI